MSSEDENEKFDSLFIQGAADDNLRAKQQFHHVSRTGSEHTSRGSPARKPPPASNSSLCPSNPAKFGTQATRSHSMRDQTNHMKEKYQV